MDYHIKYRPKTLDEVIGHEEVVKSLKALFLKNAVPKSFLFSGPSGTGKSTLARIIAKSLNCDTHNIMEMDAAVNTGVDDMRQFCENLKIPAFGSSLLKVAILEESHMLSKAAWNSLLLLVEEPPAHLYFIFCTTEPSKVIDTIKTRCHWYNLKEVPTDGIMDLLDYVIETEGLKLPENAVSTIACTANGSPRQALVRLSQIRDCTTLDEIKILLEQPLENSEVIDLCRLLVSGKGLAWDKIRTLMSNLKEQNPESIRIQIVNYLTACILKTKSEQEAVRLLTIVDYFSKPIYQATGFSDLVISLGQVVFNNN